MGCVECKNINALQDGDIIFINDNECTENNKKKIHIEEDNKYILEYTPANNDYEFCGEYLKQNENDVFFLKNVADRTDVDTPIGNVVTPIKVFKKLDTRGGNRSRRKKPSKKSRGRRRKSSRRSSKK